MQAGQTSETIEDRDQQIIRQYIRRRPKSQIALEFNLTPRQIDNIVDAWRSQRPQLSKRDPVEIVEDMLAEMHAAMDDLGDIAFSASQDSVKVGAIRQRMSVLRDMRDLMQQTGTLPRDLGQLKLSLELNVIADRFMVVLDEHGASEGLVAGLMEALRPGYALPSGE